MPNAFSLNLRIEAKSRRVGRREAHVDQIAVLVPSEAETKIYWMCSPSALNRIISSSHRARD